MSCALDCPWRDLRERYGKWNSVYVRFRRWAKQGVWGALLQILVDLGLTDDWQHMPDSAVVCAQLQAAVSVLAVLLRMPVMACLPRSVRL